MWQLIIHSIIFQGYIQSSALWDRHECLRIMEMKVSFILTSGFWASKFHRPALGGMAQWIEHWPMNQKVISSIPSQGKCLGCRPGPQLGVCERQLIQCFSPSLSPLFSFSLNKSTNKSLKNFHRPILISPFQFKYLPIFERSTLTFQLFILPSEES